MDKRCRTQKPHGKWKSIGWLIFYATLMHNALATANVPTVDAVAQLSGLPPETIHQWYQQSLSWEEVAIKAGVHPSAVGIDTPVLPPPSIDLNYHRSPQTYLAE